MNRFATALTLALMAGTTLGVASPALAQRQEKPQPPAPPKLSKPVLAVVMVVQKLQQAGDHAGALAKLAEAATVPRVDKDDALILAKLKLFSAQALKDNIKLEEGLTEAAEAPSISAEEKITYAKFIAGLASNRKDMQKAWQWYEFYLAAKPDDVDIIVQAASVNGALGQKAKMVELLSRAISLRESAGQKADRSWYEVRAQAVIDGKMEDKILPALVGWVRAFPEPRSFNASIELIKQRSGKMDNNLVLDFDRLLWAAGAMTTDSNYLEYAEAAIDRGMPNEADAALKEGIAKKLLDPGKTSIAEFVKIASTKSVEIKNGIAALEKEAKTNPRIALVVADSLANLGQQDRAVPFYKGLVGNSLIDQDTLNLRIGAALLKLGDKPGAKAAFDAVKTGPRQAIAQFYGVLAGA